MVCVNGQFRGVTDYQSVQLGEIIMPLGLVKVNILEPDNNAGSLLERIKDKVKSSESVDLDPKQLDQEKQVGFIPTSSLGSFFNMLSNVLDPRSVVFFITY